MGPRDESDSFHTASSTSRPLWGRLFSATGLFGVPEQEPLAATILRWMARSLALGLLFLWGAFFVEHVAQWIIQPEEWPPPRVIASLALHLGFLVGLVLGWRWELLGAVFTLLFAGAFFASITWMGGNPFTMVGFFLATSLPAILWLILSRFHAHPER